MKGLKKSFENHVKVLGKVCQEVFQEKNRSTVHSPNLSKKSVKLMKVQRKFSISFQKNFMTISDLVVLAQVIS